MRKLIVSPALWKRRAPIAVVLVIAIMFTGLAAAAHSKVKIAVVGHEYHGRCIVNRTGLSGHRMDVRAIARRFRPKACIPGTDICIPGHERECGAWDDAPRGTLKLKVRAFKRRGHGDHRRWAACRTWGPFKNHIEAQVLLWRWPKHRRFRRGLPLGLCGNGYYRIRGWVARKWNNRWHGFGRPLTTGKHRLRA